MTTPPSDLTVGFLMAGWLTLSIMVPLLVGLIVLLVFLGRKLLMEIVRLSMMVQTPTEVDRASVEEWAESRQADAYRGPQEGFGPGPGFIAGQPLAEGVPGFDQILSHLERQSAKENKQVNRMVFDEPGRPAAISRPDEREGE